MMFVLIYNNISKIKIFLPFKWRYKSKREIYQIKIQKYVFKYQYFNILKLKLLQDFYFAFPNKVDKNKLH